jgi:septal ring factor EnvC (AmiA/AmiB activator)
MKLLSFRILFLSILLPPTLYVLTIQGLESFFQSREYAQLNRILIQDYTAILEGRRTVKEEVARNVAEYLRHDFKYKLGVRTNVLVRTKGGQTLYPAEASTELGDLGIETESNRGPLHYVDIAAENYRTLDEGLLLTMDIKVKYNSWLSNSILLLYVFISAGLLHRVIVKRLRGKEIEHAEQKIRISELSRRLSELQPVLEDIETRENQHLASIDTLQEEKEFLSKDVETLFEEISRLESDLGSQTALKDELEHEVDHLRRELGELKGRAEEPRKKLKKVDAAAKRFRVLYKNLVFSDRAINGFLSLTDEFQLKAEEMIHRLDQSDSQIPIRRKVFTKGGKSNILEADFAYSGRIYLQKDSQKRAKVLVIGTKNTQHQDLKYIETLI